MKYFTKEILPYIIIVLVVVLIRTFIITPVTVNGPSMQETQYKKNTVERYDIVVVKKDGDRLVKRLIGLPNEEIECKNGKIYINGEEKSNEYGYGTNKDFAKVKLGSDEYFVIGDNRNDSLDSRYFGPVKKNQILGKTNFIIFPFNRFGKVN